MLILSTRSCSIVLYVCSLLTTTSVHTINLKLYSMYNIFTQYVRMPRRMRLFFHLKQHKNANTHNFCAFRCWRKKSMKTTGEKKRRMKNNRNERKRNGEKEENSEKCKKSRVYYIGVCFCLNMIDGDLMGNSQRRRKLTALKQRRKTKHEKLLLLSGMFDVIS